MPQTPATPETEHADEPALLMRELDRFPAGSRCARCEETICGHEVLFSIVLGAKDAPRCLTCLSRELARDRTELRDQLAEFVQHRDCYRQAWKAASEREGEITARFPRCLWPEGTSGPASSPSTEGSAEVPAGQTAQEESPTAVWNAGDMACGDLVLALRGRLNALAPSDVLKVTARDPAAPYDLPAWCRLTGHKLVKAEHPDYLIRRKET